MKSAKNLLIPLIVMILLALGVVVYFVVNKINRKNPENSSQNTVDLLYISHVDIASVSVHHRDGNIIVAVNKEVSSGENYVYTYSGNDKGQGIYSQSEMGLFLSSMSSFVGCVPVSENANLAEYGLDAPRFTVTITKVDGSNKVILIGNLSPDSSSCYICAGGSNSVYRVSSDKFDYASKLSNDFLDTRLLDVQIEELLNVKIFRKIDGVELSASCIYDEASDSYSFRFNKPFDIDSSAYFVRLMENVCSLSADRYEDSTNENLTKYKLVDPEYRFILNLKSGQIYTIELSSPTGSGFYGRLNGTGKIFRIDSDILDLIDSPLLVLIKDYLFYETCDNVDSVECTSGTKHFVLKLDVPKDKLISDSESTASLDGRNAKVSNSSGRSYAAMLYESIFCVNIGGFEEIANIPETAYADTSVKIYDRNHSAVVYDFYRRSDDSFYVKKNGEYTGFYVFKRELYNDGGTDTYDYGIWPAYEILTKAITNAINGVYDIPEQK